MTDTDQQLEDSQLATLSRPPLATSLTLRHSPSYSSHFRSIQATTHAPAHPSQQQQTAVSLHFHGSRFHHKMADVEMQDPLEMLVTRRPKRSTAGNR
jgi:hypothetical protein